METVFWFCLAALISSWGTVRYWSRVEAEPPPLRAERNLALARRPIFLAVITSIMAASLPKLLHTLLGDPQAASTLLGDFMPLTLLAVYLIGTIPALPIRRPLAGGAP